ncbi:SMI1/KNR4 family protein [Dickeya oryzae]|uniref:SMI1/KNR4 family protein n=1 Tax=Dickeya oryzae TaxID=1240404 RepID=A0AB39IFU1_9GAMM|nr:SMI1/KNR4 family protein [Dickeya oryzae]MCA6997175.1 SMI1/KNR4 family protein [Dickeya oryzae]
MKTKLDHVIKEIKLLSNNEKMNVAAPDDGLIKQYEIELGVDFHDDYKKVLKEIGNVFYGTIELLTLSRDKNYYRELSSAVKDAKDMGVPDNWLPICEDNGSYYCILPNGEIRYWTPDGYSDESWPDIASWIKNVWIEGN